ncbi:MAG: hypothetical protein HY225_02320 [Candidatus Vogelbacteria bacterium]|nr:hypothetical protein [Candidatus Vogelbacteria bacterium]
MSTFARLKRMVKSRVNGMFDTIPSSYESTPWTDPSSENVHKRPIRPEIPEDALFEDLQNSMTLDRRLANELYNIMSMDDALPWLMNLSRLLEKRSEGGVDRLSKEVVCDIIGGVNAHVDELLLAQQGDPVAAGVSIKVVFDSVALSVSGVAVNREELIRCIEFRSGVSKSVASWWAELIPLLLPLHKNLLPQVSVMTENGKYILCKKESPKEDGECPKP